MTAEGAEGAEVEKGITGGTPVPLMVEPKDIPAEEVRTASTVLWHCGRAMRVTHSRQEGVLRIRHWRCDACGRTEKSVDAVPQGPAAGIMREERRH